MESIVISSFPPLSYACNEAINTLCTNLSFLGENTRKIMITSCHTSEGKSFISMNILRSLTSLGRTVALVDADLRCSLILTQYGLKFQEGSYRYGLSHFLAGMAEEEQVVYQTDIPGALMVPVGRRVLNSLSLLVSPHMEELLNDLARKVDYVIVDAPPVGTVIDAAEIAKSCDGTLIVMNYNEVRRRELIETKEQLEQTGCPILGTVLNQVKFDNYINRKYYYRSHYAYQYSEYSKNDQHPVGKTRKKA